MRDSYKFKDAVVTLTKDRNYARINNGDLVPIKHNGEFPYVLRVITKDSGCPKRVERLRLSE